MYVNQSSDLSEIAHFPHPQLGPILSSGSPKGPNGNHKIQLGRC